MNDYQRQLAHDEQIQYEASLNAQAQAEYEAEMAEQEAIEERLKEIHAEQYKGLDDEMADDYQEWRSKIEDKDIYKFLNDNNLESK